MGILKTPTSSVIAGLLLASALLHAGELRVDINRDSNNTAVVTETGFTRWSGDSSNGAATGTNPVSRSFTTANNEAVTITFAQTAPSATAGGTGLLSNWYKAGAEGAAKLVSDGLTVAPANLSAGGQILMTVTGLNAGPHTLLTYHNAWDNLTAGSLGPIDIHLNGVLVVDNLQPSIRAANSSAAASAYLEFTVTSPADVTGILFAAETDTAAGVTIRNAMINGFEIDTPNAIRVARSPTPADADEHFNADAGSVTLSWQPALAGDTASHDVYFGNDRAAVKAATRTLAAFPRQPDCRHPRRPGRRQARQLLLAHRRDRHPGQRHRRASVVFPSSAARVSRGRGPRPIRPRRPRRSDRACHFAGGLWHK